MSSQYGERRPTNGWDRFGSLRHPSKFQRVSRLGFNQTARRLAVSRAGTLYIHFGGSCLTESCQVQYSLCVQVVRSSLLAALLYGSGGVGVSKTLRRGIFTRQGGHPVWHWAVELSSLRNHLHSIKNIISQELQSLICHLQQNMSEKQIL